MNDKWELYLDIHGQWHCRRTAPGGNFMVVASEAYASQDGSQTDETIQERLTHGQTQVNDPATALAARTK